MLGGSGAQRVQLDRGEIASGINFGNQWAVQPGSVDGLKWQDDNGNGVRDPDEPGLAGVSIYVDINYNGQWDRGEPIGVSTQDDPATLDVDETGHYQIADVPPGTWRVREIVPKGFVQTFPEPRLGPPDDIWFPFPTDRAYEVTVGAGTQTSGLDFGNQPVLPAAVRGVKWLDANGDGQRSADEPGLAGVIIYADLNNNSQLDRDEPATRTQPDDPTTPDVDETGQYALTDLTPGTVVVREVVPPGYQQTYPPEIFTDVLLPPGNGPFPDPIWWGVWGRFHQRQLGSGEVVDNLDFGNQLSDVKPDDIPALADMDGDGQLDADDINLLAAALRGSDPSRPQHDLTGDQQLNHLDLEYLVEDLMQARFGDANLDGVFDSSDLVRVFQQGEYEDGQVGNSGWQDGDWDGDGEFSSSDLVFAMQHGGYSP